MSSKQKMTIQEIADEAQVSKTTVSFFLNGKRGKNVCQYMEPHSKGCQKA